MTPSRDLSSLKCLRDIQLAALANLVLVFSGILPYTKLALMFICWLAPMPRKIRGAILTLMDQIGKYSLVDIFVIQFISCTLSTGIVLENGDHNGVVPSIVLKTSQTSGFLSFVLATIGSLLTGHFCLYFHKQEEVQHHKKSVRLLRHCKETYMQACSQVIPQLMILVVMFTVGGLLPAFTITLTTPFGQLEKSTHSLFGLLFDMPHFTEQPNSAATRFGQLCFLVYAIGTIYGHLLLLLIFHLGRIRNLRAMKITSIVSRALAAWSALDVVVLSMIITLIEMSTSDIVNLDWSTVYMLRKILHKPDLTDQALVVGLELQCGTYVLFAVALLHWLIRPQVSWPLDRRVVQLELLEVPETQRDQEALWEQQLAQGDQQLAQAAAVVD